MNLYKISHVNKVYKNQSQTLQALKDIQLEIPEGKIVVILGPSGSGKSTMLNILSGIDIPTSGEVLFQNKQIDHMSDLELTDYRRQYIGFIFQSYN